MKPTFPVLCLLALSPPASAASIYPIAYEGEIDSATCFRPYPDCPGAFIFVNSSPGVNGSSLSSGSLATNTLDLSHAPAITATARADPFFEGASGGDYYFAAAEASVRLAYSFFVSGPAGAAPVPVRLLASGAAEVSGGGFDAGTGTVQGLFTLYAGGASSFLIRDEMYATSFFGGSGGTFGDGFSYDGVYMLQPDTTYFVGMFVKATASLTIEETGRYAPVVASVGIDPYFEVDPAFAALGYALSFSDGINNALEGPEPPEPPAPVPLPVGALTLLGALAALAAAGGRRRGAREAPYALATRNGSV